MKRYLFFGILTIPFISCENPKSESDLRNNADLDSILLLNKRDNLDELLQIQNYTKKLLTSWKAIKSNIYYDSSCVSCDNNSLVSWPGLSVLLQSLSFVGDNKSVISLSHQASQELAQPLNTDYVNNLKKRKLNLVDAKKFINDQLRSHQVIMFNEAHDRIQTRAFFLSMLKDLKKGGVTHIAMETLEEKGNLKSLDFSTGFYTAEPIGGQIVREALRLGLKLVAYEDQNASKHTSNQRDSTQAINLLKGIAKEAGIEKTAVLAGYSHIEEMSLDSANIRMGAYFKKISGIDPLTINQSEFIEENYAGSNFKAALDEVTDIKTIKAITYEEIIVFEVKKHFCDLYIYHPNTVYIHNRPDWLLTSNKKELFYVPLPKNLKPVLVQAYVSDEIKSDMDYDLKIPYDQTFESEDDKIWFVLEKGMDFKIIFRNQKNEIIYIQDLHAK